VDKNLVTIPEAPPGARRGNAAVPASDHRRRRWTRQAHSSRWRKRRSTASRCPDPKWSKAQSEEFMRAWYPEQIANVSVHEVYPGHYTQFLYGPAVPLADSQGVRGEQQLRGLGPLLRADDARRGARQRRSQGSARAAARRAAAQRPLHRRHPAAHRPHDGGTGTEIVREESYTPGPVALSEASAEPPTPPTATTRWAS
jgi:hypothetical protein